MTKDEAATILGYLNAAYPTNRADDSTGVVYLAFLQDLDFECCRYAVKQWIKREKWFPSVAEIAAATKAEMRRINPPGVVAAIERGHTLTREENLARLAEVQEQVRRSAPPAERVRRSPSGRSSSSPAEPTSHPDPPQ